MHRQAREKGVVVDPLEAILLHTRRKVVSYPWTHRCSGGSSCCGGCYFRWSWENRISRWCHLLQQHSARPLRNRLTSPETETARKEDGISTTWVLQCAPACTNVRLMILKRISKSSLRDKVLLIVRTDNYSHLVHQACRQAVRQANFCSSRKYLSEEVVVPLKIIIFSCTSKRSTSLRS